MKALSKEYKKILENQLNLIGDALGLKPIELGKASDVWNDEVREELIRSISFILNDRGVYNAIITKFEVKTGLITDIDSGIATEIEEFIVDKLKESTEE